MKKRCIVLLDFSEHCDNLLKYAYNQQLNSDAELMLLHRTDVLISGRLGDQKREELIQRTISEKEEMMRDFTLSTLGNIPRNIAFKVTHSEALSATLSGLQEEQVNNLVYIGLKGTGLLKKIFIGSVAVDVIENTDCTVIALPMDGVQPNQSRLMVGVSNEYPLNLNALKKLVAFSKIHPTEIEFFSFVSDTENTVNMEENLIELSSEFSQFATTGFRIHKGDYTMSDLEKIISGSPASVLVLQKGMRISKDQVLKQSFLNDLLYEGKTPLIILP